MNLSENFTKEVKSNLRIHDIVWFASASAIFLYTFLSYIVLQNSTAQPRIDSANSIIFYIIGIVLACIALFLKKLLFDKSKIETQLDKNIDIENLATNNETGEIDEQRLNLFSSFTENEVKLYSLIKWHMTPYIIVLSIIDAIAIVGLVLSFMLIKFSVILPFAIGALLLNFFLLRHVYSILEKGIEILSQKPKDSQISDRE